MNIYIAGKITGTTDYNERFAAVEAELKAQGHKVLNPTAISHFGIEHSAYMVICRAMIDVSDVIYFLPDWEDSQGARLERAYAESLKMEIWEGGFAAPSEGGNHEIKRTVTVIFII